MKPTDRLPSRNGSKTAGLQNGLALEKKNGNERRASVRFPLKLTAQAYAGDVRFEGTTVNISSGGLLLTSDQEIPAGTSLTVRLNWPIARRTKSVALVVKGAVVRCEPGCVAIQREHYRFVETNTRPFLLKRRAERTS